MKINFPKGMDVYESLQLIKSFLLENCSDYPVLKNDMNIYITLTNREGMVCPYNEVNYTMLSENEIQDVDEKRKEYAKQKMLNEFRNCIEYEERRVKKYKNQYSLDLKYIATAEEKNRKIEKVEERKLRMQENEGKLQIEIDLLNKLHQLEKYLSNGEAEFIFIKKEGSKKYDYYFKCAIHFNDEHDSVFDTNGESFNDWRLGNYNKWKEIR